MVDEINCQPDNGHEANKREKHPCPLLMVGEGVKAGIQHGQDTKKGEGKNQPFFHFAWGLSNSSTKVTHLQQRNRLIFEIKLRAAYFFLLPAILLFFDRPERMGPVKGAANTRTT